MCAIPIYTMYNYMHNNKFYQKNNINSNIAMCSVCTFIVVKQSWLSQFPNSGCHQGIATFEPIPECKAQRNIGTSMPHLVSKWSFKFKSSSLQVLAFHPRLRPEIHEVAGRQPVPWSRRRRPLPSKLFQEFRLSAVVVFFNALWVYVQLRKPWPGHRKDWTVTRKSPISLWKLDVSNSASKNTRPHEVCLCMKVWKGFTNLRGEFHKPGRCISANLRLPCA